MPSPGEPTVQGAYGLILSKDAALGSERAARLAADARRWSLWASWPHQGRKNTGIPTSDDLIDRHFARSRLSELWVSDITEHPHADRNISPTRALSLARRFGILRRSENTPKSEIV